MWSHTTIVSLGRNGIWNSYLIYIYIYIYTYLSLKVKLRSIIIIIKSGKGGQGHPTFIV